MSTPTFNEDTLKHFGINESMVEDAYEGEEN